MGHLIFSTFRKKLLVLTQENNRTIKYCCNIIILLLKIFVYVAGYLDTGDYMY